MSTTERWTPDAIKKRIEAWNQRYGAPPKVSDWKFSGADSDGSFPSEKTVKIKFGSWNQAIESAGITPREIGRPLSSTRSLTASSTASTIQWKDKDLPTALSHSTGYTTNWGDPVPYSNGVNWTSYINHTCQCNGAQKKLDALKVLIDKGITDKEVLIAVIES